VRRGSLKEIQLERKERFFAYCLYDFIFDEMFHKSSLLLQIRRFVPGFL